MIDNLLISILIPSRNRIDILKRSILSLLDNAFDSTKIQLLIRFDLDDKQSIERLSELPLRSQDLVVFGNRYRGFQDHFIFFNELAKLAIGEFLFTWNDDTTMLSKNWDLEVKKYSGQFVVLKPKHNMWSLPDLNGNPIYPKKWVDLCGHVALNQHTDSWIDRVAKELKLQIDVDITVRNDSIGWGGDVNDQTFWEGSGIHYDNKLFCSNDTTKLILEDKQKIAKYLLQNNKAIKTEQNKLISVLIITRKNVESLEKCIKSFEKNTKDRSRIEFILKLDFDDNITLEFLNSYYHLIDLLYAFSEDITEYRSEETIYNELSKFARGKYLYKIKDSFQLDIVNWDEVVYQIDMQQIIENTTLL